MAVSQTYVLNGPTVFSFPFGVRVASDLTLELSTGGTVSPSLYTVTGAGPASTAVVVTYPTAPVSGNSLTITRRTPFTQVSTFSNDAAVSGSALNSEFVNVYRGLEDNTVSLGFDAPVQWTPFTPYTAFQSTVFATPAAGARAGETGFYTCLITHTSGATFVDPDANWQYVANVTSLIQAGLVSVFDFSLPYLLPATDPLVVLIAPNTIDISDSFVDLTEFRCFAQVPSTGAVALPVFRDTAQIATINFAAGIQQGTIAPFFTPPGNRFLFNPGQRLRVTGPAVADGTLSGVGIMFKFRLVLV